MSSTPTTHQAPAKTPFAWHRNYTKGYLRVSGGLKLSAIIGVNNGLRTANLPRTQVNLFPQV